MSTSSFLDRLRATGPLTPARAQQHGALGPIGKASGFADDARGPRPYDGYRPWPSRRQSFAAGDALARLLVRWDEVDQSFHLLRQVADEFRPRSRDLAGRPDAISPWRPFRRRPRRRLGRGAAGRGAVRRAPGGRAHCPLPPRSASFHNLVLMHDVFKGDILTDFPFIEASFGLSVAGVAL